MTSISDLEFDGAREASSFPARVGNFLIFITGADRSKITTLNERQRYITLGVLMLLTAAQALYAGASVAAMGLGKPLRHELGFGLFFAVVIFFIDRSIVGYVAPWTRLENGDLREPGKWSSAAIARIFIATAASVLISEVILLQFFAPQIASQLQADHIAADQAAAANLTREYAPQIAVLQGQITNADNSSATAWSRYLTATREVHCQEFGCPGIAAGLKAGYQAAVREQAAAYQAWTAAQQTAKQVTSQNQAEIKNLDNEEHQVGEQSSTVNGKASDMLAREEAFWQLTVRHGTVLFWRLAFSVLLLGIDLAPLISKLTGKSSVHDARVRQDSFVAHAHCVDQARTMEEINSGRERLARESARMQRETSLQQILADADVERFRIALDIDLRKRQLSQRYRSGVLQRATRQGTKEYTYSFGDAPDGAAYLLDPEPQDSPAPPVAPQDIVNQFIEALLDNYPPLQHSALVLGGVWALHDHMPGADGGSGATVWRARKVPSDQRWYVVKTIPAAAYDGSKGDAWLRQRAFSSETRMNVRHENIGEIKDSGLDKNLYYLVSPMYEPGSLNRYCTDQKPQRTLQWCAEVILQVLSGLAAASAEGFVHLDIKPGNIVLDGTTVRIIDWGLSRMWRSNGASYTAVARGTPFYASPEQMTREQPGWDTPLADLYSAGAVFYWLITDEAPLAWDVTGQAEDPWSVLELVRDGVRPERADLLVPGVPKQVGLLIDRWLSYQPVERVSEGAPASDALRRAHEDLAALHGLIPALTVGKVTAAQRRPPRSRGQ
jgi:Domain of unknown function (DUF4407)/Protein kinase domain